MEEKIFESIFCLIMSFGISSLIYAIYLHINLRKQTKKLNKLAKMDFTDYHGWEKNALLQYLKEACQILKIPIPNFKLFSDYDTALYRRNVQTIYCGILSAEPIKWKAEMGQYLNYTFDTDIKRLAFDMLHELGHHYQ